MCVCVCVCALVFVTGSEAEELRYGFAKWHVIKLHETSASLPVGRDTAGSSAEDKHANTVPQKARQVSCQRIRLCCCGHKSSENNIQALLS